MTANAEFLPGLSSEEIEKATRPLEEAWTLPPAAYVSEQVYGLEVERIMRRSWLPLARLDQLPEPGDYLSLDLFGQPVMVVHGTDGEVRVLSRVCLHRAADLAPKSGRRKLFTCPYHAWSYDTQGQLVRAPLMEGAHGFDETACALPRIRAEVWQGFVMANLDPDAEPFAPQVEGFRRYFENFKLADMAVTRILEFDSGWNWKVLVENFMEAYHHIGTHAETFEPIYHARDSKIPDNDGPWSILHMPAADEHPPEGPPLIPGLTDAQRRDLFAGVIFPHFMLAVFGSGVAWYQVLPTSAGHLTLKIHICMPKAAQALEHFEAIATGAEQTIAHVHTEDIEANDLVWRGLNAPLTRQGRLSPLERSIWQLNQFWIERMIH